MAFPVKPPEPLTNGRSRISRYLDYTQEKMVRRRRAFIVSASHEHAPTIVQQLFAKGYT